ncbi:hypothetical protein ACOBR2_18120 [Telmatobacter bradus]|uniref:hypothetical protein n=1 Tax=Telmatobacter bradus TaxID=474953 RepID=UPI003B42B826
MVRAVWMGAGLLCVLAGSAGAQQTAPLSDVRQLMQQVEEHQRQLDKVREDYTYTSSTTTEDVDSSGRVTKTETAEEENFFVNGHPITRLVKKDGKALDGKELEKETERVTKRVEKASQTPAGQELDAHTIGIRKLLAMMDVRNPQRVNYRGRATIKFDFAGRKDAKTHGIEEDLSKKLEGTIWVDEADRQVAHMEVRLNDNFHVGGGMLANIQKGSSFSFDQVPVKDGLWLPTGAEIFFQARVLLVKGVRQRLHERDYDYKRFHIDAEQGKDVKVVGGKS